MSIPFLPRQSYAAPLLAAACAVLLSACSASMVQPPFYGVTDTSSFKTYGAPDDVMRLEVHDASNAVDPDLLAGILSTHGFPPRITFVTTKDGEQTGLKKADGSAVTLHPKYRVVAVTNPSQSSFHEGMCTAPQSEPTTPGVEKTRIRFSFCAGDKIVSETTAYVKNPVNAEELDKVAGPVIQFLFPPARNDDDRHDCNTLVPGGC